MGATEQEVVAAMMDEHFSRWFVVGYPSDAEKVTACWRIGDQDSDAENGAESWLELNHAIHKALVLFNSILVEDIEGEEP